MAEIHVHGMGKESCKSIWLCISMPSILLPSTTGTGFLSLQGHSQTHGCDIPLIPCPDPMLPPKLPPHVLLTPSMSHPTCLELLVLQGRESISLPPPFDGLWQIAGAKQIAAPAKNHRCRGAGAGSITHPGNCICLCQKGLGAEAALLALCYRPVATWHRPTVPQLHIPGKGVSFPKSSPPSNKSEGKAYLYKVWGRHKAGHYLTLKPYKGGT